MAHTPVVSVRFNIGMSNIISLVRNIQYGYILSSHVMSPRFLQFKLLLLFNIDPTSFKTFDADFTILESLAICLSSYISHVLVLLGIQRGSTIFLRVGLGIYLRRSTYILGSGLVINTDTYESLRLYLGQFWYSKQLNNTIISVIPVPEIDLILVESSAVMYGF